MRSAPRALTLFLAACFAASAIERPGMEFKVFQFPADRIPRIDGKTDDWAIVPDSYAIGTDQLRETPSDHDKRDPKDLDVR